MTLLVSAKKEFYQQLKTLLPASVNILYNEETLTKESLISSDLIITEISQLENFSKTVLLSYYEKIILLGNDNDDLHSIASLIQNSAKYFPIEYDMDEIFRYIIQYFHYYKARYTHQTDGDMDIVGESNCIKDIKNSIRKLAPYSETVTILGETGSGKEVIARSLHRASKMDGDFITLNCSAIPDSLIESELFGSIKGAFTGSINRIGFFERAQNGTLFLDEIGDISLPMQSKLLRAIENKTINPIGSTEQKTIHTRIITATSKDLREMVKLGKFREDLYYRINTLIITVPPLRDHKEDIPYLCNFFLDKRKMEKRFSTSALNKLMDHDWPGNVRELLSTIRRAEIHSAYEKVITDSHISFY